MSGATAHSVEGLQGTTYEVLAAGQTDSPQVAPGVVVYLHGVGSAVGGTAPFWDTRAAPGANGQAGGQPAAWQAGCGQVIAGLDYAMMGRLFRRENSKNKLLAEDCYVFNNERLTLIHISFTGARSSRGIVRHHLPIFATKNKNILERGRLTNR